MNITTVSWLPDRLLHGLCHVCTDFEGKCYNLVISLWGVCVWPFSVFLQPDGLIQSVTYLLGALIAKKILKSQAAGKEGEQKAD